MPFYPVLGVRQWSLEVDVVVVVKSSVEGKGDLRAFEWSRKRGWVELKNFKRGVKGITSLISLQTCLPCLFPFLAKSCFLDVFPC